jgi:putative endonuclease
MSSRWLSNSLPKMGRWLESSGLLFWRDRSDDNSPVEQVLGRRGEKLASDYLKRLGYRIVDSGHRQRLGEIDLIAVDGRCVVFVEVKTWKSDSESDPSMAVNLSKQRKLTRAGLIYLKQHRLLESPARFDVVSIVWNGHPSSPPKIRHFPNAFEATGLRQLHS